MTPTEAWARPPAEQPDLTPKRLSWERQFRHAALLSNEAADRDIASFWLRDVDCASPEPHYAARLMRAVMTGAPGDAYREACDWLTAAALAFSQDQEARQAETGALYESPVDVCRAIRRAP